MVQKYFPNLSPFEGYGGFDFCRSWLTFPVCAQNLKVWTIEVLSGDILDWIPSLDFCI
jgi:hypothetical protein